MARTVTEIQADYDAVHAAWLKSLKAEQYSQGDRGLRRSRSQELYDQMMKLSTELKAASGNGAPVVNIGLPARDYL
jgi:hypothetical protein